MVAQIPNAGLYCATIDPNTLNTFLSAMYKSSFIGDAFPNEVIGVDVGSATVKSIPRNYSTSSTKSSLFTTGLPVDSSLIQTIDVAKLTGCGTLTHEAAVAAVAGQCVSTNINDIMNQDGSTSWFDIESAVVSLLHNAQIKTPNLPLIINISMGPIKNPSAFDLFCAWNRCAMILVGLSLHYPNILQNVLILFSGGNASIDISNAFSMKNGFTESIYFDSGVMDHLYVVASQKGTTDTDKIYGCPVDYASVGSPNVFSASNCNVKIPDQYCIFHGTSFGSPAIANLIARTFLASNKTIPLTTIAKALWNYQTNNNGTLPTALQLLSSSGWTGPVPTSCNLTCKVTPTSTETTNNCACFTSTTLTLTTLNKIASGFNTLNSAYGIRDYSDISAGYIVGTGTSSAKGEVVSFYGYMDANASFNVVPINSSIIIQPDVQDIFVQGINFSGTIVGDYYTSMGLSHGFILPTGGGSTTGGVNYDFPGASGGGDTWITGINNSGTIAGFYTNSWDLEHGFYDGKSYDFPGAASTFVQGINDSNTIAGYYYINGESSFHGFYDGLSYDFPGTTGGTIIYGLNNHNSFVGSYWTTETATPAAFIATVAR